MITASFTGASARRFIQKRRADRIGAAIGLLDKMGPGAIAGAVSLLGEQVELEGRRATRLPLRFKDGLATLGVIKLGQTPPLF